MAQNIPPHKSVLNANAVIPQSAGASPAKERPPRPPSNRLSRRTSTDAPSGGQRSPRRNTSAFEAKPQGERVKVVVRLRPPFPHETAGGVVVNKEQSSISVFRERSSVAQSEFEFDKILAEDSIQADVYQAAVQPVVEDVLNGYNGTIMAYGQTGAGKTYTLSSIQPEAIGMIPRAASEVFAHIAADTLNEYTVFMSYIQIYMEMIQDLLRPENENLQIRESDTGVFVAGVHETEVKGMEDCLHLLQLGERNRVFAFTRLNAHSSRSHAIVMLTIIKRHRTAPGQEEGPLQKVKIGKLFMVDLAGSERLKKSLSTGLRASEAKSINLSLTALGMCINARADPNSTHVPFRDSKLTRLLQESLGGNAKTSLVIAVANAEDHIDESLQSLQFGSRAMRILTRAVVNERMDVKVDIAPEILAELEQKEDHANALALSLMAKENELVHLQVDLKEEKERSSAIVEALRQEQSEVEEQQKEVIRQREAQLEAEKEHREALALQLQETKTEGESLQQQSQLEKDQLRAEAEEAGQKLAKLEQEALQASLTAAHELETLQHNHAISQSALQQQLELERDAAVHKQQLEVDRHVHALQLAQQALTAAQTESDRLRQKHVREVELCEQQWQQRLNRAEALSQQQSDRAQAHALAQDATIAQLRGQIDSLTQTVQSLDESLSTLKTQKASLGSSCGDLQLERESLMGQGQRLKGQVQQLEASVGSLRQELLQVTSDKQDALRLNEAMLHEHEELQHFMAQEVSRHHNAEAILETELASTSSQVQHLQQQLEAVERNRTDLEASWLRNRRLNHAARIIQRRYRLWRSRNHVAKFGRDAEAMYQLSSTARQLAEQKATLEGQRRAHLAWSGQAMVSNSLNVMQEAVETIRAAFLLPQKDLKNLSVFQQKLSSFSSPSGTSTPMSRNDSAAWAIRASSASGGGFSPFITPASTPRGNATSRSGSVTSSNAGTPRWSSSSYGPVAFGSPVKTDGMSTPRAAAMSLLASSPKIPAVIAGMPMVPALSPSVSGYGSSPGGVPPKAPPRRTTSANEADSQHMPTTMIASSMHTPGSGPRRSRSNLSEGPSSRHIMSASPLSEGLRTPSRHKSNSTEAF